MEHGKVLKWFGERGFGFILPDAGGDNVFAHITEVQDDVDELPEGARVTFEIGESRSRTGKTEAKNIRVVEGKR